MYATVAFVTAAIFTMITTPSAIAHRAPMRMHPAVVENGSDVVTLPFPADTPGATAINVAFGPDGTAYFVDAPGEVARITPAGVYTKIAVPRATTSNIIYARGSLWMNASGSGIVKVDPDGSHSRWYSFYSANGAFYVNGIALGAKGTVYMGGIYQKNGSGALQSVDTHGVATPISTPVVPTRLAVNRAGQLYFGSNSGLGFGRLEADGSTTLLPWPYPQYSFYGGLQSLVGSVDGNLYFSTYVYLASQFGNYVGFLGRISPSGVVTQIPLPLQDTSHIDDISVDFGGNIWLAFQPVYPSLGYDELYQYDIYNGKFSGPFEPTLLNQLYSGPFVGPDDNIWTVRLDTDLHHYYEPMALQVFVRKVQTLEPASLSVTAGSPTPFSILETHYNGPWTATSLNPSVATVLPASSATGTFTVRETKPGNTSIAVRDAFGNVSYESVTAH